MSKLNCLIVDDDRMSRALMTRFCAKIDDLNVVGICQNGLEALDFLSANSVDLLFLDVEMPDLTGVELLQCSQQLPTIVFISSKREYAVEAFAYRELVADYIPKPATLPRLLTAIERVRKKLAPTPAPETASTTAKDYIFVRSDGRFVRINLGSLMYVENVGDYVLFKTEAEQYLVHATLKNIAGRLDHPDFLKVHRSYIINLSKIVDVKDGSVVVRKKVIPVSRAHRSVLLERIDPL